MGVVNLNTIKNWFKTNLKPTQSQFWDTWDSFRHKQEKVPVVDIEGIDALLQSKTDTVNFEYYVETNNEAVSNLQNENAEQQTQIDGLQTQFSDYQPLAAKGQANGYASLDGGGKVPASQLPNSVMTLEGEWNADTNTPTLTDGTGNAGMVYEVTTAGTTDFGNGNITFAVGDFVVYGNDGKWYRSINSNEVVSVNGKTGVVNLTKLDVGLGNADNTADADKPISTATQAALNGKQPLDYDLTQIANLKGFESYGQLVCYRTGVSDPPEAMFVWQFDKYKVDIEGDVFDGKLVLRDLSIGTPPVPITTKAIDEDPDEEAENLYFSEARAKTATRFVTTLSAQWSRNSNGTTNLSLATAPTTEQWDNAVDWAITWKDGNNFRKISGMSGVSDGANALTLINNSGTLQLNLANKGLLSTVTIPSGANLILYF